MTSLRVVVRIRPFQPHDNKDEKDEKGKTEEKVNDNSHPAIYANNGNGQHSANGDPPTSLCIQTTASNGRNLIFDRVFPPTTTQHEIYQSVAYPLIQSVVCEGINACIFAFGNTGAGKTYSMIGPDKRNEKAGIRSLQEEGILPRAAKDLFSSIARRQADIERVISVGGERQKGGNGKDFSAFRVRLQFLEVYCESVYDLLAKHSSNDESSTFRRNDNPSRLNLQHEKNIDGFCTNNSSKATEITVSSMEQLISMIEKGSMARTTAATNVHGNSSRSHAIIILIVEHRWRTKSSSGLGKSGGGGDGKVRSRTSRLTMVDLAGAESMQVSHGGHVDVPGTKTNLGLLVLGRVLKALASSSSNNSKNNQIHIPYRDSTLTKLMQPSLSGSAKTIMLTCVSPSMEEAEFTTRNLAYAVAAKSVSLSPKVVPLVVESASGENDDPMENDVEDTEQHLNRRCIFIECINDGGEGYVTENVFARVAGKEDDPLILYIHGSGSQNSSMVWNDCVVNLQELAINRGLGMDTETASETTMESLPSGFFHVAIDCPGYGRSTPGDKQIVRSYPAALIRSILRALGRQSVLCLVGSSQGAAAVLNAALELNMSPKINGNCREVVVHHIAVCHPVCHSPLDRFKRLDWMKVMMVYDVADKGHPVGVGRVLRDKLNSSFYFEFDSNKNGDEDKDWLAYNFARELWKMLTNELHNDDFNGKSRKKKRLGRRVMKIPMLTRVAGGVFCWERQFGGEVLPWYRTDSNVSKRGQTANTNSMKSLQFKEKEEEPDSKGPIETKYEEEKDPKNTWYAILDEETNLVVYENIQSKLRVNIRPTNGRVIIKYINHSHNQGIDTGYHKTAAEDLYVNRNLNNETVHRTDSTCLFTDDELSINSESTDEEGERQRQEKQHLDREKREAMQENCDLCKKPLLGWIRLHCCRCAICACCIERTLLYFNLCCPNCGDRPLNVSKKTGLVCSDVSCTEMERNNYKMIRTKMVERDESLLRQYEYLNALQKERANTSRIVLEYGSVGKRGGEGSKTSYSIVLKLLKSMTNLSNKTSDNSSNMLGTLRAGNTKYSQNLSIRKVEFNINPGYNKPTAVVNKNDTKKENVYRFEYAMARTFPCFITIFFENTPMPNILIPYVVQKDKCFRRRIVVQTRPFQEGRMERPSRRSNKSVLELHCGQHGDFKNMWVRFDSYEGPEQSVKVEYV